MECSSWSGLGVACKVRLLGDGWHQVDSLLDTTFACIIGKNNTSCCSKERVGG